MSSISFAEAYEKVRDSCSTVLVNQGSAICSSVFSQNASQVPGIVITCSHCVVALPSPTTPSLNSVSVAVKNVNGVSGDHRVLPAKVLGYCAQADVAILLVDGITASHPVADFSLFKNNQTPLRTGDAVFVVGNPAGRDDSSCSPGWVRDHSFELEAFRTTDVYLNAPTTFGNSGSPVFDMQSRIVSILSWGPSDNSGNAITSEGGGCRSDYMKAVADAFASNLTTPHPRIDAQKRYLVPYLGLTGLTSDAVNCQTYKLEKMMGYIITKVEINSPFSSVFGTSSSFNNRIFEPVLLISADGHILGQNEGQSKLSDIVFFKEKGSTMNLEWRLVYSDPPSKVRTGTVTFNAYVPSTLDDYAVLKYKPSSKPLKIRG